MARTILATIPPPVALPSNKKAPEQGFSDGRYWARTSDPQLVEMVQAFAPVRARSPTPLGCAGSPVERTLQRTRTNAEPCHSCHARCGRRTRHRDDQKIRTQIESRHLTRYLRGRTEVSRARTRASHESPERRFAGSGVRRGDEVIGRDREVWKGVVVGVERALGGDGECQELFRRVVPDLDGCLVVGGGPVERDFDATG